MSATALYRSLCLHRFEPAQLEAVISNCKLEHFLFGTEPCDVNHEHWEYGGLTLDHARYSFRTWVRGEFCPDRLCIGFLRQQATPCWINGAEVKGGNLVAFAERSELAYGAGGHAHWVALQISREELQLAAMEVCGQELSLPSSGMVNLEPAAPTMIHLRRVFDGFASLIRQEDDTAEVCRAMILEAVVQAIHSCSFKNTVNHVTRSQHVLHTVKQAELYVLKNLADGYSSEGFARCLSMSERNLELQFKRFFGMSPRKWREYLSLNIAYRRLARAGWRSGLVSDVAADCGFFHPSRFAASYMQLFGERPHETGRQEQESVVLVK